VDSKNLIGIFWLALVTTCLTEKVSSPLTDWYWQSHDGRNTVSTEVQLEREHRKAVSSFIPWSSSLVAIVIAFFFLEFQ